MVDLKPRGRWFHSHFSQISFAYFCLFIENVLVSFSLYNINIIYFNYTNYMHFIYLFKFFQRCVSCCEGSECNFHAPTNASTAIFTTITPYNGSSRVHPSLYSSLLVSVLVSIFLVLANSGLVDL